MVKVFYCSDLRRLALKLIDKLQQQRPVDPFTPDTIIVPNRDISRWLSMTISETTGITANIDFVLPSEWMWSLIRQSFPDISNTLPTDRQPMKWSLFELFGKSGFIDGYPQLKEYLSSGNTESRDMFRWQLASQLASAFDQYQIYRPDMLINWESGYRPEYSPGRWQADLWTQFKSHLGEKTKDEHVLSRADFYKWLIESDLLSQSRDQAALYLFNPGLMSRPFLQILSRYASKTDVFIYSIGLNESQKQPENYSHLRNTFGSNLQLNRSMLNDNVRGLSVTELDEKQSGKPQTVLSQIKYSILEDRPIPVIDELDSSISIHACHSRYREIETIHSTILRAMSDNPDLHAGDILVLAPDIELYKTYIHSVFSVTEDGLPSISYTVALPDQNSSQLSKAFLEFLELIDSRFEFRDIIAFLGLEPVMKTFSFTSIEVESIRRWFEENRVEWGYNSQHRVWHQQPPSDLQTWSLALERGWLGQIATENPGEHFNGSLAYTGINSSEEQLTWARVQKILGYLSDAFEIVKKPHTKEDWADRLKVWTDQMFSEAEGEEQSGTHFQSTLDTFIEELTVSGITEKIPFSIIRKSLDEQFKTPKTGPVYFTRGVTFSSMVPVRSIPYKFIGILGLNDGEYPRLEQRDSTLDLIQRKPEPGERDRRIEDQSLFLESILAAQEYFWCSYLGRDSRDDQQVAPSSVLQEFIRSLTECSEISETELIQYEKLHGFSPGYFSDPSPLGISKTYLNSSAILNNEPKSRGFYSEEVVNLQPDDLLIHSKELDNFFRHPLKSFCKNRLDIHLDDAWDFENTSEFDLNPLDRYIICENITSWYIDGKESDDILDLLLATGILPYGRPGERTARLLINNYVGILTRLEESGYSLKPDQLDIDIAIGKSRIKGSLPTLASSKLLNISSSTVKGGHLLSAWIRHLLVAVSSEAQSGKSQFVFKKGSDSYGLFSFKPVTKPKSILENLLNIYRHGQDKPLPLFPNTAYYFTDQVMKGVPEQTALERTLRNSWSKWNSYINNYTGDQTDPYTEFIFGPSSRLEGDLFFQFREMSMTIFPTMIHHLTEEDII